jgi:hypothetical protein
VSLAWRFSLGLTVAEGTCQTRRSGSSVATAELP